MTSLSHPFHAMAAPLASFIAALLLLTGTVAAEAETGAAPDPDIVERFEFLSQNGNSSCARAFMNSIADLPSSARLQGSCCGEMSLHRYSEQIAGLKQYEDISDVPPDPYDVEAGLAQNLMVAYRTPLSAEEQGRYDLALATSDEKGPCCCQCWRWEVFGGLGKLLIREHGFTGERVAEVWNLSHGCGGDAHLHN